MHLSIVFQGSLSHLKSDEQKSKFLERINYLQANNSSCEIIISSWEGEDVDFIKGKVDKIILSADPGSLPGLKFDNKENNVNRLIVSSTNGINAASGEVIVKLRTDLDFKMKDIVSFFMEQSLKYSKVKCGMFSQKIITTNFFTLDPYFYERLPFHISDWFQMGMAVDLKKMWDIKLYSRHDATYYESCRFAKYSNMLEKQFRSKFAVEQYLTMKFAENFGKEIPIHYHNDYKMSKSFLFYSHLVDNYIVKNMASLSLSNTKYKNISSSIFFKLSCINEVKYNLFYWIKLAPFSFLLTYFYMFILSLIRLSSNCYLLFKKTLRYIMKLL